MSPQSPNLKPFERLRVTNGLAINAERWQLAHNYHRQRQNLHFQSSQCPGIVSGLGVAILRRRNTQDPAFAPDSPLANDRWIEIQPGIAIDNQGNPIVVPQATPYPVSFQNLTDEPITIYIVLSYVDPDLLDRQEYSDRVEELFRIDEVVREPLESEVEVCRISIAPDSMEVLAPQDVFVPGRNELDFRYRKATGQRAIGTVHMACLSEASGATPAYFDNFSALLGALPTVYPQLEGHLQLLNPTAATPEQWDLDMIYAQRHQLAALSDVGQEQLSQYLEQGGLLVVGFGRNSELDELAELKQGLEEAITDTEGRQDLQDIHRDLQQEYAALDSRLREFVLKQRQSLEQDLDYSFAAAPLNLSYLPNSHPLRNSPFTFGQFPPVGRFATQYFAWKGIVLILGPVFIAWGGESSRRFPRDTIRAAQEMGVNLLHFAWQQRQFMQLQSSTPPSPKIPSSSEL